MIHERFEAICRSVFHDPSITLSDEMEVSEIPGWDSVGHINLMFALEQEFGLQFAGNGLMEFASVGDLKQFLAERSVA